MIMYDYGWKEKHVTFQCSALANSHFLSNLAVVVRIVTLRLDICTFRTAAAIDPLIFRMFTLQNLQRHIWSTSFPMYIVWLVV